MTFNGTVAEVNTALAGLSFNPTADFVGAASLQIVTSDQGNTGSGGTLTDNDTVAITVTSTSASSPPPQDIGGPGTARSSSHSAGTYTVVGERHLTSDTHDRPVPVPVHAADRRRTLTAQVVSPAPRPLTTSTAAKAGVMMRDTLAANSMYAMADQRESANNSADQRYGSPRTRPSAATTPPPPCPSGCGSPGPATRSPRSARRTASPGRQLGHPDHRDGLDASTSAWRCHVGQRRLHQHLDLQQRLAPSQPRRSWRRAVARRPTPRTCPSSSTRASRSPTPTAPTWRRARSPSAPATPPARTCSPSPTRTASPVPGARRR